jgi:hypothetical protein
MKKTTIIFFIVLHTAAPALAAQNGIGLGVIVGEPTGVSFKTWIDSSTAIDAAAAWSFSENDSFQFHLDYLIHPFAMPKPPEIRGTVSFYYGIGGRLKLKESDSGQSRNETDDLVGIRFPLGFSHILPTVPVELFAEIVPILDLAPDTDADVNAAVGARYYFK